MAWFFPFSVADMNPHAHVTCDPTFPTDDTQLLLTVTTLNSNPVLLPRQINGIPDAMYFLCLADYLPGRRSL